MSLEDSTHSIESPNETLRFIWDDPSLRPLLETLGIEKTQTNLEHAVYLLAALKEYSEKNKKYNDLWVKDGWLGSIFHLRHKSFRLIERFWRGKEIPEPSGSHSFKDLDDAIDLINYAVMFMRNVDHDNEIGE